LRLLSVKIDVTFVNEPSPKIKLKNQNQQPPVPTQPPNTVAVGYWADMPTYNKYRAYATRLYNQIITDENGQQRRMLEHNDVNEFVYFAVEYFMSTLDWTEKIQSSGNFMDVVKQLVKQIGPVS